MSRQDRPNCPDVPEHGPLFPLAVPTRDGKGWYCGHQAHDPRPATHPMGKAAGTRKWFETAELPPPWGPARVDVTKSA